MAGKLHFEAVGPAGKDLTVIDQDPQDTNKGNLRVQLEGGAAYDALDDSYKMKSVQKKWRDSFVGASLDATKWDTIQTGAGQTVTASNGVLTINTGTTINAETIIQSKEIFTIPCRLMYGFYLSQRIANQEFYVELVSVNPTTLAADGKHGASWRYKYEDYTSGTNYAVYEVWNNSLPRLASGATYAAYALTSYAVHEIEAFGDECWFHTRPMDSAGGRGTSNVRHQQIPEPNNYYKIRIRAKNLATAPASATTVNFQFINMIDFAELTAEITAGRGITAQGQGLYATVSGTVSANLVSNGTTFPEYTTAQTVNTTTAGTARDAGTVPAYNRYRIVMANTGDIAHLIIEQSESTVYRETHRIPIPGDGLYRTFEFPWNLRFLKVRIQVGTTQTALFVYGLAVRTDGPFDLDKTVNFNYQAGTLAATTSTPQKTLNLGTNHSNNKHRALLWTDQAGTLVFEQSRNGTAWVQTEKYTVTPAAAGTLEGFTYDDLIVLQYVRVYFTNGATATGAGFELSSALIKN